jgi:hypothetical protein
MISTAVRMSTPVRGSVSFLVNGGGAVSTGTLLAPPPPPPPPSPLDRYQSRTLHADELVQPGGQGGPPPSPAVAHTNVLYQATAAVATAGGPTLPKEDDLAASTWWTTTGTGTNTSGSSTEWTTPWAPLGPSSAALPTRRLNPQWQKRHTVNPHTEWHKLPFAPEIVGTYSCHGIEPVYDDDCVFDHDGPTWATEQERDDAVVQAVVPATTTGTAVQEASPRVITTVTPPTRPWPDKDDDDDDDDPVNGAIANSGDAPAVAAVPPPPPPPSELIAAAVAKINQDRGGVAFPYGNCPKTTLFAVYDGHGQGGELVTQFALHDIQHRLE